MKHHNWIWQRFGMRQCQKCGMVVSIQNHRRVGECKGEICDKCGGLGYIKKEESKCHKKRE